MTVSSQTNNATFVGNGVTTDFPLPFRFFSNGDVFAYFIDPTTGASTPMVLGTDYTLAGAGEPEVNGNAVSVLTTTVPLANLRGLYVERIMQEVQSTDIVNQGEFFASTHEDVFDRLTMLIQQANANSNGAIRVAIGDPEPQRLAPAARRANLLLGFDALGQPITVAPISGSATDLAINLANNTDPAKGAALVGFLQAGTGAVGRTLLDKAREVVSVKDFGAVGDGVTDDTAAIQAALDSGKSVHFPAGKYVISAQLNVTTPGQKISGDGWGANTAGTKGVTRITSSADIKFFRVVAPFVHFEHMGLISTHPAYSQPHIHFAGDSFSSVNFCRFDAVQNFSVVGGGITLDDGAGGIGGSVGIINNINITQGTITVRRSDVHIKNSWIWANSRPYGIYATGSVGNLVLEGCDVLPPQTVVAARKAAIYLSGALSNPRILGCNFDGNSSLSTGKGLLAENGVFGLLVSGCYSFGHNEDSIVLDSIIAPHVIGCTFKNNNLGGNGAADITLKNSYAQPLEKPLIQACSFIQAAAISGTVGPAVKLEAGTTRSGVRIVDNSIHQPGTGGGYTDIEILLEDGAFTSPLSGSLAGNRGVRTHYSANASASFLNTDTFKTINYGVTLAYAPRPDQFNLCVLSTGAPPSLRFNSAGLPTTTSLGLGLHGTFGGGTINFSVSL